MTPPSSSASSRDQVLAALEACTGALRALELASANAAKEEHGQRTRREHLPRASELLQEVIAELQLAEGLDPDSPTTGFILAEREKRRRRPRGEPQ